MKSGFFKDENMTVKEKIKIIFESRKGEYISGEELAAEAGCTRGAVWKAVKSLEAEGYRIDAVTNKGYCLTSENDIISEEGIRKYLETDCISDIHVYRTVDSTNLVMKKIAAEGAKEGTLVVSGEQSAGRGRLGREFFSPPDSGIYMSILLRPSMEASDAIRITTAAAAATSETIERITGKKTGIKWVNDIYTENRKVCGILTEASFNIEFGGFEYVVPGIGINVYEPEGGFPDEILGVAGAVLKDRVFDTRNKIIAGIAESFMKYYSDINSGSYFESYEKRLMWKGRKINVISPSGTVPAVLKGVDRECRLIVEYENGETGIVSSGEISIRLR